MPKSEKEAIHAPTMGSNLLPSRIRIFLEFILANMKLQSGLNFVGSIDNLGRINTTNSKDFRSLQ